MEINKEEKVQEILKSHMTTLKRTSKDMANTAYMCNSQIRVVNFDKIPREYAKRMGLSMLPCSNDALHLGEEDYPSKWCFIEFKNGTINVAEIYRKLYDSLIMLLELKCIPDIQYAREHMEYILVYNSREKKKLPESQSQSQIYGYLTERAKQERRLFGIDKFEGYLFDKTHTYSKQEFEDKFVTVMEG